MSEKISVGIFWINRDSIWVLQFECVVRCDDLEMYQVKCRRDVKIRYEVEANANGWVRMWKKGPVRSLGGAAQWRL